ncbi:hypothetical protein ND748_01305 [Frankia sp. AiPs1]|uniref:hypothetical protein n=1 Tax=Frankia sp. AiPs1 TaxID=573493 RepID=UPI0020436078|nr:hypothetical protein [Frankia sp. AiPs1]MCM3920327.1 hypothetical protein [Frankia sp. AiPs1]
MTDEDVRRLLFGDDEHSGDLPVHRLVTSEASRVASPDGFHCAQACLVMAVERLGHPQRLTLAEAEQITGFRPGVETWPYAMLAWLAENGYEVRHEDALDAVALTRNPEAELRRSGLDEEALTYLMTISDFERERAAITRCLATRQVSFVPGVPDPRLLPDRLHAGWLPLLSLDAAVLTRRDRGGFEGHMVLVTATIGGYALVQDPGPPARWDWAVPLQHLATALRSPAETSGTITYVRPAKRQVAPVPGLLSAEAS